MNEIMVIKGVKARLDESGTVELNLEHVARGLGFTQRQNKNGKVYESIRWERISGYLDEFGFPPQVGEDGIPEFIPENIFYKLCFKAENETARVFQNLVTDEILPAIRKTGSYSIKQPKDKYMEVQAKNAETRLKYAKLKEAEFISKGADKLKSVLSPEMYAVLQIQSLETVIGKNTIPRPQLEQKLIDATGIAEKLGILSEKGNPHSQAVGAIINSLCLTDDEIFTTAFEKNGHQGSTTQYTYSVLEKVRHWLNSSNYPKQIVSKGKSYRIKYKSA